MDAIQRAEADAASRDAARIDVRGSVRQNLAPVQTFMQRVEVFKASRCHGDHVFDANATDLKGIEARLDRQHIAFNKRGALWRQERRLMNLKANSMPGAVADHRNMRDGRLTRFIPARAQ